MGKRILFSPIGGTDPIKYCRDGSMLHISRIYKPDVVYLYLSKEMLENHRKDNRYVDSLERLGILLDHHFEIKIIERENLENVQQYDTFYKDFKEIIKNIEEEMDEDDELILNMASGTPAMKSALLVLATLAEYRFQPIQVSTPLKRINSTYENRQQYDVECEWELNEDNGGEFVDRSYKIRCLNLLALLKIDMIKKHIKAYDYTAAFRVANEIKNDISEESYRLLEIADARIKLNKNLIHKLDPDKKFNIYPIQSSKEQKLFEYALVLQLKVLKEEYADFIRGITPIVVDLYECILKEKCNINLKDLCTEDNYHVMKWDQSKLEKAGLLNIFEEEYKMKDGFKFGPVYSVHLVVLMQNLSKDPRLVQALEEMREIEQKVRNIAAHEIVSVTDEWFIRNTGKSAKEIMKLIKELFVFSGIKITKEDWNSYDIMNSLIENTLG